jgi:hypothetical protein
MVDRPKNREGEFLRERAARLRAISAAMPRDVKKQLAEVAAELERRAAKFNDHSPRPDRDNEKRSV